MSVLRSHNNKTRGGLGRVCATGMYRSIEHAKFPKFQPEFLLNGKRSWTKKTDLVHVSIGSKAARDRASLSGGLDASSSTKHGVNSTARWRRLSVFESINLWPFSEVNALCRRSRRVKQWEENTALFCQVREPLKKDSGPIHRCGEKCSSPKSPCKAISLIRLDSSNWANFSSQQKTPWYREELCA